MPPHHQVGVGADAGEVVDPADHHVVGRELLQQRVDLDRLGAARSRVTEHVAQREHRPHRVADGVVDLPELGRLRSWRSLCPRPPERPQPPAPRPPGPSAMTAGMPTPSYAAPQTARPGTRATSARTRATRSTWPRAYCGSPPPHRWTCASTGSPARPASSARSARERATSSSSGAWSAACSPCRPSEVRSTTRSPPAARTHSHLAKENVEALIARPSTGGTRKPDVVVPAAQHRRVDRRKARVTTATDAASIAASSRAAAGARSRSSRAVGAPAWRAPRSRRRAARRRGSEPTVSRKPAAVRASSRTVAPVRTREPARTRRACPSAGAVPRPRRRTPDRRRPASSAACSSNEPRAAIATSCGTAARAESARARPAYTPPSSGSTSRSTTSSPRRAPTRSPTLRSSPTSVGGSVGLEAHPGQPLGRQHTGGGQLVEVERHPHQRARERPQRAA